MCAKDAFESMMLVNES